MEAKERPLEPATAASASNHAQIISPFEARSCFINKIDASEIGALDIQRRRSSEVGGVAGSMLYATLPLNATADEPVTECFFYPGTLEAVLNIPGFPQPLVHPTTPTFRLANVPGKGMGLFSTRDLKMGDLILCERPLIITADVAPVAHPGPNFTDERLQQYCQDMSEKYHAIAVDRMRPKDKAAFMALANSHTRSRPCKGIMETNALSISGLLPSKTSLPFDIYGATCKDVSRMNHSCSPNTDGDWDLPSLSYRLYAVRDIPAGEELTFSYLSDRELEKPTAERQEQLERWRFVCTCTACTDPASDARRTSLEPSMQNLLFLGQSDHTLPVHQMINKSLQQLDLLTTEKMQCHRKYFKATSSIMDAYISLGDAVNASKWAAKVRLQVWAAGRYDPVINLESLLNSTNTAAYEAHPFWRIRADPKKKAVTARKQRHWRIRVNHKKKASTARKRELENATKTPKAQETVWSLFGCGRLNKVIWAALRWKKVGVDE